MIGDGLGSDARKIGFSAERLEKLGFGLILDKNRVRGGSSIRLGDKGEVILSLTSGS
jgi:hypothetical protein